MREFRKNPLTTEAQRGPVAATETGFSVLSGNSKHQHREGVKKSDA
jgi:hypothetical protein